MVFVASLLSEVSVVISFMLWNIFHPLEKVFFYFFVEGGGFGADEIQKEQWFLAKAGNMSRNK